MLLVDAHGIPLSIGTESANANAVRLIERLVEDRLVTEHQPERLIYDKACDSNPLRDRMQLQGINFICPTRKNRKYGPMPDQCKLGRYQRRWIVERTISWLHNFRRTVIR